MNSPVKTDPYASHLPVLRALADLVKPRRILEFGAGDYSTPFFLSLDIEALWSVETHPAWAMVVETNDTRHTVSHEVPPLTDYDLIFIDDGVNATDRALTISNILAEPHPVVVVHDAEVFEYRNVLNEKAPERTVFCAFDTPQTAVVWPPATNRSQELLDALEDACESS